MTTPKVGRSKLAQYLGHPVTFLGYDGNVYHGNITEILPRGIQISYYVPRLMRDAQTCLPTKEARKRVIVQM